MRLNKSVFHFLLTDADAIVCKASAGTADRAGRNVLQKNKLLSQAELLEARKRQPSTLKSLWG